MTSLSRDHARVMDQQDPLGSFRDQFVIAEPNLLYLDGNSLGRLQRSVPGRVGSTIEQEWGGQLIRAWNNGWWDAPQRVGASLAPLLGAEADEVIVCDQTSVNLFKLATAALQLRPERPRIVSDMLNFPSDLYVLQGIVHLLGNRHKLALVESDDGAITPNLDTLLANIDSSTALVSLSHVTFKSGYLYDMRRITQAAHERGALVLWDLSHSAGVIPIELDACDVDFAVGCTYKYLNGGPGAPAFLFVNRRLQDNASTPIWAWWGDVRPFGFDTGYQPAPGIKRFLTGTAPIVSMAALEESVPLIIAAGIDRIRQKSIALTNLTIALADATLLSHGFIVGTPREPEHRGSHVSLRHPDGYRINRALIEEMNVIPDFREPDNLRLGFAPLYTTFQEVWDAIDRLRLVMEERRYENFPRQRLTVT